MARRRQPSVRQEDERHDRPLRIFRERRRSGQPTFTVEPCEHLLAARPRDVGSPSACEDHQPEDGPVVHLRTCLECGHVGCCDSSRPRHATVHASSTGHPVIQSAEPGERWRWCYPHELLG
jgi:hypothetical protein